jgi:hypothetical protein
MPTPTTFTPIALDVQELASKPFPEFVTSLLGDIKTFRDSRTEFYQELRRSNTKWVQGSRWVLAMLGAIAFLLTGIAAAVRFIGTGVSDKYVLLAVLAIYAVMGAISFYERGTDKTTAYFRQVNIILSIRDLTTKLQFEILKELTGLAAASDRAAAEQAARERLLTLAQAFCADVDKAATGEVADWRTEVLTSLSELEEAAKKGTDDITNKLKESIKAAEKTAADAKAAADQAAKDAKAAAKSAEDAGKPGGVNLTLVGDFDNEAVIFVDGKEATRSAGKTIGLERVPVGQRRVEARAQKGTKTLQSSVIVDIHPGLQELRITLA